MPRHENWRQQPELYDMSWSPRTTSRLTSKSSVGQRIVQNQERVFPRGFPSPDSKGEARCHTAFVWPCASYRKVLLWWKIFAHELLYIWSTTWSDTCWERYRAQQADGEPAQQRSQNHNPHMHPEERQSLYHDWQTWKGATFWKNINVSSIVQNNGKNVYWRCNPEIYTRHHWGTHILY